MIMNKYRFCGIVALAMLVMMAGPVRAEIRCAVPSAPQIHISPQSSDIRYDFSQSSVELTAMKGAPASPYAPGVDTATGGLRHDAPQIKTQVKWSVMEYPARQQGCIWYDQVNVTIELNPKIYVASDPKFESPACREAILEHEKRHVAVDRAVINSYAAQLGEAIQEVVDQTGAVGPFPMSELEERQQSMARHINELIDRLEQPLQSEMARQQAAVDTPEEYQRLSDICNTRPGRR